MTLADRTLYCIAHIKDTQDLQSHTAEQLQVFSRYVANEDGDEALHVGQR